MVPRGSLSTLSCNQSSPENYRIDIALHLCKGTKELLEIHILNFAVCKHCIMDNVQLE